MNAATVQGLFGGKASLKSTLVVSETGLPGKKNEFGRCYLKSWSCEGLPNRFLTDGMRPVTEFLSRELSAASRHCANMHLYATTKAVQLRTSEIAKERAQLANPIIIHLALFVLLLPLLFN